MTTYQELKERQQAEINVFPLGFAFNDEQFEKMMKKWNLTTEPDDLKKIASIGAGGYILKSDIPAFSEMMTRHKKEEKEFQKNKKNLIDQIFYEMQNHEFAINWQGVEEVCAACRRTPKDLEKDEFFAECWKTAKKKYYKMANENNWF